jgi:hypothetical protein
MKYSVLLLAFMCLPYGAFSQNNFLILGTWVKTKAEAYDKKVTSEVMERNMTFMKYTFELGGKAYLSLTYNEKGYVNKFNVKGDIIDFAFTKMKIESLDSVHLVLIELDNGDVYDNSIRTYFTREKAYLEGIPMAKDGFYTTDKDTVFFESTKIFPMFNHKEKESVNAFLDPFVEGDSGGKESYVFATFVLDTNGKMGDVKLHHHINKKYDKNLLKALSKTEGLWTSPEVNGKKVKVLKEIEFAYLASFGSKGNTDPFNPTNKIFPKEYRTTFKEAVKSAYRGNYKSALEIYGKCLNLTPDSSNIDLQKGVCFDALNDAANSNLMLELVKKSNLNYLFKDKK